jgi:hypothetical protein
MCFILCCVYRSFKEKSIVEQSLLIQRTQFTLYRIVQSEMPIRYAAALAEVNLGTLITLLFNFNPET